MICRHRFTVVEEGVTVDNDYIIVMRCDKCAIIDTQEKQLARGRKWLQ